VPVAGNETSSVSIEIRLSIEDLVATPRQGCAT
jgi:hypothetical protein